MTSPGQPHENTKAKNPEKTEANKPASPFNEVKLPAASTSAEEAAAPGEGMDNPTPARAGWRRRHMKL